MTRRPDEALREELESTFTPMLRRAWQQIPSALVLAFVDHEGECVDYVSALDAFDAKVLAAHALVLLDQVCACAGKLALQVPFALEIVADGRALWVRKLSEDYAAMAVASPDADRVAMESVLTELAREFRSEAGLPVPSWDSRHLEVMVREAVGWAYAPSAYTDGGIRIAISDVIGRWTEPRGGAGDEVVCFRVRTQDGHEITLVHDPAVDGWRMRA